MIIQNSECSLNGIVNDSSVCVGGVVRRENNSLTQIFFFVVLINTISSIPSISPTQSSSSFLYKHCFHSALFVLNPFLTPLCPEIGLSFSYLCSFQLFVGHIICVTCPWNSYRLFPRRLPLPLSRLFFRVKSLSFYDESINFNANCNVTCCLSSFPFPVAFRHATVTWCELLLALCHIFFLSLDVFFSLFQC